MNDFKDLLSQVKYQKYFLKINGVIPINFNEFLPINFIQINSNIERIIEWTFTIILVKLFILYSISFYLSFSKSFDDITGALTGTIIFGYSSFISLYFKFRRETFLNMLDFINKYMKHKFAKGLTYVTMKESYDRANKLSTAWGLICLVGVITMSLVPILMGKRDLPLTVWYPFDEKAKYVYEFLYVIQFIGQIQMSLSFSNSSGIYLVFAIFICGQYDVLFCSIKNFIVTAEISANADEETLQEIKNIQDMTNDEAQQYLYLNELENPLSKIVSSKNKEIDDKDLKIIQGLRDALKNCVKHHVFILRLGKKIENFFSPVCFVKLLQITIQLCLLAFVMIKLKDQDNVTVRFISLIQYLNLTLLELLLLSYFGELITTQSLRLSLAFNRSIWYLHSTKLRQDILIILQYSVRPVVLTAGKLINMNAERFRLTITTAFSFLTLLQRLDARK